MARRFRFFEQFHYFTFNPGVGYRTIERGDEKPVVQYTNTILLGKTLIEAMLKEVDSMIQQESDVHSWSDAVHEQVSLNDTEDYCNCDFFLIRLYMM